MKGLGGFFELELNKGDEYHSRALKLNLGRNAFKYVLKAKAYKKVYLPFYTCDSILEPVKNLNLDFEFYQINKYFRPVFDFSCILPSDVFVYNNYFGICDTQVAEVAMKCKNLIIDDSQAFFSQPLPDVDTFYSPRKYFGVPDGGYLYTDIIIDEVLENDNSSDRFGHLIGRIEAGPSESYQEFRMNEQKLSALPLRKMSRITQRLLQNINYRSIKEIRKENFQFLHEKLAARNLISFDLNNKSVPMVYPFLSEKKGLRDHLIKNKIFIPCYWKNVSDWCSEDSLEYNYSEYLVPLPVDQRYGITEMKIILSLVNSFIQ